MNIFEKVLGTTIIAPTIFIVDRANKALESITGKGLIERSRESIEKEKEEHHWKWAGKKLIKGTISGIIGVNFRNMS